MRFHLFVLCQRQNSLAIDANHVFGFRSAISTCVRRQEAYLSTSFASFATAGARRVTMIWTVILAIDKRTPCYSMERPVLSLAEDTRRVLAIEASPPILFCASLSGQPLPDRDRPERSDLLRVPAVRTSEFCAIRCVIVCDGTAYTFGLSESFVLPPFC